MKRQKVAVIGNFALKEMSFNGQTIKTRILAEEIERQCPQYIVRKIDTYDYVSNPIKLAINILHGFFECKDIIILLSRNGRKVLFPLFYYLSKIFHRNIWHNVIGAASYELVKQNPSWVRYLNSFKSNWVELNGLAAKLRTLGVTTVSVLPNFKRLDTVDSKDLQKETKPPFRFCTFSRVEPMKGIEDAINAIKMVNMNIGTTIATIDIYGQIEKGQESWFDELLKDQPSSINYCGVADYDKSVKILKDYFMLLFPTRYTTEGFPGTIIDAYAAGLPVIASQSNELVDNDVTGWTYASSSLDELVTCIEKAIAASEKVNEMRLECTERAKMYQPGIVVGKMLVEMGLK